MIADTSVGPASYDHILEEEAVQDECNMTTWMQYEMIFREGGLFIDRKNCKENIKMIPRWYNTLRLVVCLQTEKYSVASCTLTINHHQNINLTSMHRYDTHQCTWYCPVVLHSVLDDNLPCTVWLLRSI